MTDPKDAEPKWPNGLQRILDKHGVKSVTELLRKKVKPKPEPKPAPRTPYKQEIDEIPESSEPD